MSTNTKKLPVPENVTLRWELWPGIGIKELIMIGIATGIASAIAVLFCRFSSWKLANLAAVVGVVTAAGFCAGLFTKMDNNLSAFDYVKNRIAYSREQQTFWYCKKEEVIKCVQHVQEENH